MALRGSLARLNIYISFRPKINLTKSRATKNHDFLYHNDSMTVIFPQKCVFFFYSKFPLLYVYDEIGTKKKHTLKSI